MCGIAGIWSLETKQDLKKNLHQMLARIIHRGPDDEGSYFLEEKGLALGHRRLSIIDLSSAGHQPMHSHNDRYTIVYNGEVYNFKFLRQKLEEQGITFRGNCDTEVLLELIAMYGLENALREISGMFSFALWDKANKTLHLARDHLGEKPLYWGIVEGNLLFGSELKALMAYPGFKKSINVQALHHYFSHGYVPEGKTVFQDINKVPAGHMLTIKKNGNTFNIFDTLYWSPETVCKQNNVERFKDFSTAQTSFENLFSQTIDSMSISDVPIGCFLSGGIDSTLVAAFMQKNRSCPLKTFSVGFDALGYDETPFAAQVAKHLGTEHHAIHLKAQQVPSLLDKLVSVYDEPFGDASQLPTLCVSELASKQVKVVLTGDGGDEVFAGYNRHIFAHTYLKQWLGLPETCRKTLKYLLRICEKTLSSDTVLKCFSNKTRTKIRPERFKKLNYALQCRSLEDFYDRCIKVQYPKDMLPNMPDSSFIFSEQNSNNAYLLQVEDLKSYLPGDILTKVDRATMSCSIESRAPFLNEEIVRFGLNLPNEYKIKEGKGKYILRKTLENYVPKSYFDRGKTGFGLPLEIWLKTSLSKWCEDLINQGKNIPFVNNKALMDTWNNWPRKLSSAQSAIIWRYLVWIAWWKKYEKFVKL